MINMNMTDVLPEKQRKKWSTIFVASIVAISVLCLSIMNSRYDSLARYPYKDSRSRALIKEYLNKEEIDYIIEYSIAPNLFISFIQEDGFNIYRATEYKHLSEILWDDTPGDIVEMVEETRNYMDVDTLISYLQYYSYSDIEAYLSKTDIYSEDSTLVLTSNELLVWLDEDHTVSTRTPYNLQNLSEDIPSSKEVLVVEQVQEPLSSLCSAIDEALTGNNGCGGLTVTTGYISYEQQSKAYEEDSSVSKPGHDEHQLGLAIDFKVNGIGNENFALTEQYEWLMNNAWKYGFVQTYENETYHYRYIGLENATALRNDGLTFQEYSTLEK